MASIIRRTDTGFILQVEVAYKSSMLDPEETIQTALNVEQGIPIGSGVTEAACKVLVKQRL